MSYIDKFLINSYPYLIAELGINHNGKMSIAKKMICVAKKKGADCVKFQHFYADELISVFAKKAPYQAKNKEFKNLSQQQIIKNCELGIYNLKKLKLFCIKKKIDFLCTPFDLKSLKDLKKIGEKKIKVSSCNFNNKIFLEEAIKLGFQLLLSTGMADKKEVDEIVNFLKKKKSKFLLFQCTSDYPATNNMANINVLNYYKKFKVPLGYSDHTKGNVSAIGSIFLGCKVVEKHFTLDKKMPGIDQKASIVANELYNLKNDLVDAWKSLGNSEKKISAKIMKNRLIMCKSLVAKKIIKKNEKLTYDNMCFKRPGTGIPSAYFEKYIGRRARKTIKSDKLILERDLI